jgi:hypothetical protein
MERYIVHANTTSPAKRSPWQWKNAVKEEWKNAREQILPALASFLVGGNCGDVWVPASDLFKESDLDGMALQRLFSSLWNLPSALESRGTFAYTFEQNGYILLRRKFGSAWFILGCL